MVAKAISFVCFLALSVVTCEALVDTYKWKYEDYRLIVDCTASVFFTYEQEFNRSFALCSSSKCAECIAKYKKEQEGELFFGERQAILYGLNGKGEGIDKKTYESVVKCAGDETCEKKALKEGAEQIDVLRCQYFKIICDFKIRQIKKAKEYVDHCTAGTSGC